MLRSIRLFAPIFRPACIAAAVLAAMAQPATCVASQLLAARDIGAPSLRLPSTREDRQRDAAAMQGAFKRSVGMYDTMAGYLYLQRGDTTRAFLHILSAARQTPDARLYLLATEIAIRGRSQAAALKALEQWKADFPRDPLASNYHLQLLIASGQIEQTSGPLQAALDAAEPSRRQIFIYSIPDLYAPAKKATEALAAATPALTNAMQQPETAFIAATSMARMQLAAGHYPQALQSLHRASVSQVPEEKLGALPNHELPGLIAIDLMRASLREAPETSRAAEALISDTLRRNPSRNFMMVYARALAQAQRLEDAQRQLDNILRASPDFAVGWALQGIIQLENKQLDAAETSLQRYLALGKQAPDDPAQAQATSSTEEADNADYLQMSNEMDVQAYLMLARIADLRDSPEQAQEWIARIAPPSLQAQAQLQRIEWLVQQGKYALATEQLHDLPFKTANGKTLLALLASHIHEKQNQYQEAARILDAAVEADKNNPELLYARGNLYWQMQRHAESERDLRKVIQLKPNSAAAYNALGYSLADRNQRLPEAHALIAKAIEIDPGNSSIQDSMGWVEYRQGNLPQALNWLKQAYENAREAEIAAHYGEVLWISGETEQARSIWAEGLKLDASNKVLQETMQRLDGKPGAPAP